MLWMKKQANTPFTTGGASFRLEQEVCSLLFNSVLEVLEFQPVTNRFSTTFVAHNQGKAI